MTEFLDIEGGRIAYDVTGSGPLVVLPPGIGVRGQAYLFLAPVLAQAGYRVATADLRGHGESSMGWAAIHRHRRRRRPGRIDRSPGRARQTPARDEIGRDDGEPAAWPLSASQRDTYDSAGGNKAGAGCPALASERPAKPVRRASVAWKCPAERRPVHPGLATRLGTVKETEQ